MHWCRICDEFPRTAKEYLNHLHSKEHKQLTQVIFLLIKVFELPQVIFFKFQSNGKFVLLKNLRKS